MACPSLDDVTMIRGQDDRAAAAGRPFQQRGQMADGVHGPVGTHGIGAVESVVDGVQDAGDELYAVGVVKGSTYPVVDRGAPSSSAAARTSGRSA
jgi:hypothetical protein